MDEFFSKAFEEKPSKSSNQGVAKKMRLIERQKVWIGPLKVGLFPLVLVNVDSILKRL